MHNHLSSPYRAALPALLTTADVAKILAVSKTTVRRLQDSGDLDPVRVGGSVRFRAKDVASLVEAASSANGASTQVANASQNGEDPAGKPGLAQTMAEQGHHDEA
jgi:excisionase family DNA binding protein